ncbi:MAG: hypothetical protein L7U47_02315, partial [Alphaproteobacteria bacterium]|nr:hypothetical protein [Alphaproteobacteria bacterium]
MSRAEVQELMEAGDFSSASAILATQLADAAQSGGDQNTKRNEAKAERLETLYLSAVCARYQDDLKAARAFVQ